MANVKDELWALSQRSRGLGSFLSELRLIWNDSAAQEISGRYLNPQQEDDARMQQALGEQQSALEQAQSQVATIAELAAEAEKLAQKIEQLLGDTSREVSTANNHYQTFTQFNNNAYNQFPTIRQFINNANQSCQGIAGADGKQDVQGRKPINSAYAGKVYPSKNRKYPKGVQFDSSGYPEFTPYAKVSVKIQMRGDHYWDYKAANIAAGFGDTPRPPKGFTWHHHQDMMTMQLVPLDLHTEVKHSGGVEMVKRDGG